MAKIGRKLPFLVFLGIKTAKKIHKNNFWSQVQIFLAPTPPQAPVLVRTPCPRTRLCEQGEQLLVLQDPDKGTGS